MRKSIVRRVSVFLACHTITSASHPSTTSRTIYSSSSASAPDAICWTTETQCFDFITALWHGTLLSKGAAGTLRIFQNAEMEHKL